MPNFLLAAALVLTQATSPITIAPRDTGRPPQLIPHVECGFESGWLTWDYDDGTVCTGDESGGGCIGPDEAGWSEANPCP